MAGYMLVLLIIETLFLISYAHAVCNPIHPLQHGKINYHPSYSYYQVSCDDGYILLGNPQVLCTKGEWSNPPPKCIEIESNACELLSAPENGKIECDEGLLSVGKSCKFRCFEGYVRTGSETRICLAEKKWSGIMTKCIPKTNANVDRHRSEIRSNVNYYKGFRMNDESAPTDFSNNPCTHFGCKHICKNVRGRAKCRCRDGYILDTDKKSCIDINECLQNNGGCEHRCLNTPGSYFCRCDKGFHLNNVLKKCVDIDECKDERLKRCEHICENTEGSYICRCQPGYVLIEDYKCEGCRKGSFWSTEENGCLDCPPNSFTQSEGKTTISDCFCFPGFTGNPADNIPCTDIDECASDNFGCSHECVNTPGEAFCNCPFGYTLDNDNKTCIDIDECSIKNGGCEGRCFNTNGSFYCTCPTGYRKSNKTIYSCEDIDECLENNGGCQQTCNNYRGGYYCGCKEGYRLDSSFKNCTDVSCPNVPLPHFSTKICKKDKVKLNEMDNYPTGTVCTFRCASGFKDASESNVMECLEDGTWQGSLANCKSQRCPPLPVPEHGNVHPSSCSTDGNTVKQKCTFTCQRGYKLKGRTAVFKCKNDLTWKENDTSIPVCKPEEIRASIECVRDIKATLQPGKSSHNITIPKPVTNMESYNITPENIIVGKPMEFPAGITKVLFSTSSPSSSRIDKCMTSIHVIDDEPPVFISCPEDIWIENAKVDGEFVTWEEPEVTDNVKVVSLKSSVEPNTTITPGSYLVEYVARDSAGNIDTCTFKIDIIRMNCDNLTYPINGAVSCMDLLYGKLCQPVCEEGYMRHPSDPVFYSCDDTGIWEPSDVISDCLPFSEAVSSTCPEGSELMILEETDEEICLECSSKAVWSSTTRKCEAKTN